VIRAVLQRLRELGMPAAPVAAPPIADGRLPVADWRNGPSITLVPQGAGGGPVGSPGFSRNLSEPPKGGTTNGTTGYNLQPVGSAHSAIANRQSPMPTAAPPPWRFVGLAHGNYALFETAAGLVLLDRRAAHERVWFDRLREQFRAGTVPSQRLLLPVPIELDAIAAALLLDRLKFLHAHGFELAEFGRNFFRVEAVPAWMEPADAEPFLRDLLGAFRDGTIPDHNTELAREELARLAAAKAVRLAEGAGETELRALVAQLFATRTPLTNPFGRPTYIELNHGELARRFQK
jgi:DNA mismatch repair protein MutL